MNALESLARDLAVKAGLDPDFVSRIGQQESGWNPNARSAKGAIGVMQLMPATAAGLGVDPNDPQANVEGGVRYLAQLDKKFNGDQRLVAAAYNAGPGAVQKAGGVPNFPETQAYVAKVADQPVDEGRLVTSSVEQPVDESRLVSSAAAPSGPTSADVQRAMVARTIASAGPFGMGPDIAFGARQTFDAAKQMVGHLLGFGSDADKSAQSNLDAYRATFQPDAFPGSAVSRGVGQALATAPVASIGGPALGVFKAAGQGAATGAGASVLTPVYGPDQQNFWTEKAKQAAIGAGVGAITGGVGNMVGRALSPNTSPEMRLLLNEGVTPTPGAVYGDNGTLLGNVVKYGEQKMAGTAPILGDAINMGQARSMKDFNVAIYNRVLAPLGKTFDGAAGQDALGALKTTVGQAYDDALARSVPAIPDTQFQGALAKIASMVPDSARKDFLGTIQTNIASRLTPAGTITPSVARDADSALGVLVRDYAGSTGSDAVLGRAYMQAQAELRQLFARYNPDVAPAIAAANKAYAQLVQLQEAAKTVKVARADGLLTPADYLRGIKAADYSLRDTKFSSGKMLNQDLAQAADKALSSTVPNSGTAGRTATLVTLGGLAHPASMPLAAATLAGSAVASLPYLPFMQRGAAGLLAMRPQAMQAAGDIIKRAAPYLGAIAPAGIPYLGGLLSQ